MKNYLFAPLAMIACVSVAQESPQIEGFKEMVELFRQSTTILKSCKDQESTKIATDQLIQIKDKAEEIGKKITQSGQFSKADRKKLDPVFNDLQSLAQESLEEVTRIRKAKLFTPELAEALNIPFDEDKCVSIPNRNKKDEAPAPTPAP